MTWTQLLAYVTGTVDQELLLRNEYLVAENRILKAQIKGRLLLSEEFIRSGQILLVPYISNKMPLEFEAAKSRAKLG